MSVNAVVQDDDRPVLSIILPSFRSGAIARRSAEHLAAYLEGLGLPWELIIVDDGSGDVTSELVLPATRTRVIRFEANRGKGAAVRAGMLQATGRVRVFTDVDLPYDLGLFPILVEYVLTKGFHVVIGDRTLPGSRYTIDLPPVRRLASSLFSSLVGRLITGGFFDTQCGLKAFRDDIAVALFAKTRIDRFAFDVELIYVALKHRLDIKRVPVQLRHNDTSSVHVVRDSLRMLGDVLRIKLYQLRGCYESGALDEIVAADFRAVATAAHALSGVDTALEAR